MCDLIPVLEADSEEYGPEYSDSEYYCEECGEFVEAPCKDDQDEA